MWADNVEVKQLPLVSQRLGQCGSGTATLCSLPPGFTLTALNLPEGPPSRGLPKQKASAVTIVFPGKSERTHEQGGFQ